MTAFTPQVGRVFIDADGYPSGTSNDPTYQLPKMQDIADALVSLSSGWAEPWVRTFNRDDGGYCETWLERADGSEKAQIVFYYNTTDAYIHGANKTGKYATDDYRLWICFKPSTSGANLSTSLNCYDHSNFCSTGNAFRFTICNDRAGYFYNQDWYWCWLAEESSRRVILIAERATPLIPDAITIMGDSVISSPYNTGSGLWEGGVTPVAHPEPDTHPELFFNWAYPSVSWVPPSGGPHSLQWYKTDHTPEYQYDHGLSIRNELLGANVSTLPPYAREPIMVHRSYWSTSYPTAYGSVWPDSGGTEPVRGNGLKGVIDPDFVSYVASHDLTYYSLLNGGEFIHIRDGLCVGWDPAFGAMPT